MGGDMNVETGIVQAPGFGTNTLPEEPTLTSSTMGTLHLIPGSGSEPFYETELLVNELKRAMREVRGSLVGFDEIVMQSTFALLTREHQLLYSRAGTAKSFYANILFGHFRDAKTFSIQLTKGTTEESLVGAINIQELKNGNVIHNTEDSIVEAHFAFIDEIFDGNDVALRSMLGILNERKFNKGKQQQRAVLHSAIAATNYLRANDVTEAATDRFVFKSILSPIQNSLNQLAIDHLYAETNGRPPLLPADADIPLDHITHLADIVEGRVDEKQISAPAHILAMKNLLIDIYVEKINERRKAGNKPEIYVSPRTRAKTRDLLNASALLDGRTEVIEEDILSLRYMITTVGDEEQEETFRESYEAARTSLTPEDCATIDYLGEAHQLFGAIIRKVADGETLPTTLVERIKIFFGLTTIGEHTYGKVRDVIQQVTANGSEASEMKDALLSKVVTEIDRLNGNDILADI